MKLNYTIIEGEEWKPIFLNGQSTYYDISNKGRVRSLYKGEYKLRSFSDDGNGYLGLALSLKGGKYQKKVHRLVGIYFIPNPENLPEVCHDDHNKYNNDVTNLKWGTKSQNSKDSALAGKLSRGRRKLPPIKIGKFFANICLKSYPSIGRVVKDGYPRVSVTRNLNKPKTYRGFNWKIINE